MNESLESKKAKSYRLSRTIYNIVMGFIIIGLGFVMFYAEKWNLTQITGVEPTIRYIFGGLCLIYGGFRLYRGFKKEY